MAKTKPSDILVGNPLRPAPAINLREKPKRNTHKGLYLPPPLRDISNHEVIRPRDLPMFCGLSRTTCWRLSKDPASGFPKKLKLSAGAVGYYREAIENWVKSREEV